MSTMVKVICTTLETDLFMLFYNKFRFNLLIQQLMGQIVVLSRIINGCLRPQALLPVLSIGETRRPF